tara:strand:+ start:357 stop:545 length:189 start_codon:yes stop_codon:yes gene_type:complete
MSRYIWDYTRVILDLIGMLLVSHGVVFALHYATGIETDPIGAFVGIIAVRLIRVEIRVKEEG